MELKGLRIVRKERGYTQLKVSMDLSMSREAISLYETGKRSPDIQTLMMLSRYFDVSIDYLITGEDFTPQHKK